MKRRKVFDWFLRFGIIASVLLGFGAPVTAQEKPDGKRRSEKSKMVSERSEEAEEDSGVIEIVVKIPKPEALIFSRRMDTKYKSIGYEKSFTDRIIESAKQSPF
jgi:hypothetical protein